MSLGGEQYWLLLIDDCTNHAWSYFSKEKFELKNVMVVQVKDLKTMQGIDVKYIHCNNIDENEMIDELCKQEERV